MALKDDVDPDLWNRCYEEHLSAPVECQTGPLMLYLILHCLQNCSESTLNLLLLKVQNLNIKDHAGEGIVNIVCLVNTAVTLLKSSSNADHDYITHDFSKDLLHLFQTTLVPAFNQVFADIETSKQVEANSISSPVVDWPTLDSITQLLYEPTIACMLWASGSKTLAHLSSMQRFIPGSLDAASTAANQVTTAVIAPSLPTNLSLMPIFRRTRNGGRTIPRPMVSLAVVPGVVVVVVAVGLWSRSWNTRRAWKWSWQALPQVCQ